VEDLTEGLKDIVNRHFRRLMTTLEKYEAIDGEGASNRQQDESKE